MTESVLKMMLREFSGRDDPVKIEPILITPEVSILPIARPPIQMRPPSQHWSDDSKPVVGRRALLSSSSADIEPDSDEPDDVIRADDGGVDVEDQLLPKESD